MTLTTTEQTMHKPSDGRDVLIRVENVSKKFCRSLKKSLWYGVQDIATEFTGRKRDRALRPDEFWALNDVSFELRRGECLGLIGRNGAGKTTLLKLLNGLIKPDCGQIEIQGKVGALIALGAGFNPVLTGRENIYVNASVLGLRKKEIDEKIDEIVDFAEIDDFIDSPVQSYSSGMQVRLGFAVATALNPDVLFLDEVLAVGDAAFRHKCYHRINKLSSNAAVVLVSHNMDYVGAMASSAMLIHHGRAKNFHNTVDGINAYNEVNKQSTSMYVKDVGIQAVYPPLQSAVVRMLTPQITYGGKLSVELEIICTEDISGVVLLFKAVNAYEQTVMEVNILRMRNRFTLIKGHQVIQFEVNPIYLHDGVYDWSCLMARQGSIEHLMWFVRAGKFEVCSDFSPSGQIPYLPEMSNIRHINLTSNSDIPLLDIR